MGNRLRLALFFLQPSGGLQMTLYALVQRRDSLRLFVRDAVGGRLEFTAPLTQRREWLAVFMAGSPVSIVDDRIFPRPRAGHTPTTDRPDGAASVLSNER